jgi:hypothetical protein
VVQNEPAYQAHASYTSAFRREVVYLCTHDHNSRPGPGSEKAKLLPPWDHSATMSGTLLKRMKAAGVSQCVGGRARTSRGKKRGKGLSPFERTLLPLSEVQRSDDQPLGKSAGKYPVSSVFFTRFARHRVKPPNPTTVGRPTLALYLFVRAQVLSQAIILR